MSTPPTQPPSTPPSRGRDDEGQGPQKSKRDRGKEFKISKKGEEEEKKQSLFDIASESQRMQELKAEIKAEEVKGSQVSGVEAKTQVSQIGKLISKMVTDLKVGQVDGTNFAQAKLGGADVPSMFAGSNLTLSYTENGLLIRFDNFSTPQAEQNALNLVEKNKEQLADMMQALQAKNIQVSELNIGANTVALPKVAPLPPPFQAAGPSAGETRREGQEGGGEEEGQGGPT